MSNFKGPVLLAFVVVMMAAIVFLIFQMSATEEPRAIELPLDEPIEGVGAQSFEAGADYFKKQIYPSNTANLSEELSPDGEVVVLNTELSADHQPAIFTDPTPLPELREREYQKSELVNAGVSGEVVRTRRGKLQEPYLEKDVCKELASGSVCRPIIYHSATKEIVFDGGAQPGFTETGRGKEIVRD